MYLPIIILLKKKNLKTVFNIAKSKKKQNNYFKFFKQK